jgi:hypothetical protein
VTVSALAHSQPWQVALGSEGIAAAQFARRGFDVTIQSGRDKPWYELLVAREGSSLKVMVRGSADGAWSLTQAYLKQAGDRKSRRVRFHEATDLWLAHLGSRSICCLVQFHEVPIDELPRIYLASPAEVAHKMREIAERLDEPTLYERYEWLPEGETLTSVETLPAEWAFSEERIHELLGRANAPDQTAVFSRTVTTTASWRPVDARGNPLAVGLSA